jgi:hypothetical protein
MKWLWMAAITTSALTLAPACQDNSSAKLASSGNASTESTAAGLIGTDMVA